MDCFGDEEDDADGAYACQRGLEPEYVTPGGKGDDDASDEWPECWTNLQNAEHNQQVPPSV